MILRVDKTFAQQLDVCSHPRLAAMKTSILDFLFKLCSIYYRTYVFLVFTEATRMKWSFEKDF